MLAKSTLGAFALAVTTTAATPLELTRRAPEAGVVITQCSKPGVIALAYDDGPSTLTSELVDILDEAGAKGTFFWTGTLYGCIYDQADAVKKAYESGHQIASHTWTHPSLGGLGADEIKSEMTQVEDALVNLIGVKPAYMRPPYLDTGGSVLTTLGEMGYKIITDDVDSQDWNGFSVEQSQAEFEAAGASGNGHIPLMHETYDTTVQELTPWLISWAQENGLEIVTVAECLDDADGAYQAGEFTGDGAAAC